MRVWKCLLALCLLFLVGESAAARTAAITVNTSGSGITIPSDFVGLSIEVGDFVGGYYQGIGNWTVGASTLNGASFINLAKLLPAAGWVRVGGSTANAGTAPTITPTMASNLHAFTTAFGWSKLIYDLDLVANDSTTAATTATNLASAFTASNVIFQFGNEPSGNFTAANYATAWNSYYTAVTGAVAGAGYAAIDDIINIGWGNPLTVVGTLTPGLAGTTVSQQQYAFCRGTWANPTASILLSSILVNPYSASPQGPGWFGATNNGAGYLYALGLTKGAPIRMTETNNICLSGQSGVSDRLVGGVYMLDEMMILANAGWAGINVHQSYGISAGNVIAVYNPFVQQPDGGFSPNSTFYAMYMFSQITGQQILPSSVGGNGNVACLATKGGNGNANIICVNNDPFAPVSLTFNQSGAWTTAKILGLQDGDGQGCYSASLTLGGQPIGEGGTWTGSPSTVSNGTSGGIANIPPCGAALIQIQP